MTVVVRSDFFEDIRTQVLGWCTEAGIHIADPTNLEHVLFAYFSVQRRLIEPRPREVKWSRELLARALTDVEREAVAIIERQTREGVNLTPRLSQSILDPEFNDGLLDDWGIHHLHLSDRVRANGFVERDGRLLFVMVRPESMYFIDLLDHRSFADDQLLQIVHDNWSETIAFFRAPTISRSCSPPPSSADRRLARRCMTLPWQAADGTVYLPPGGGTTTFLPKRNGKAIRGSSGLSPQVVIAADGIRQHAVAAERWVRENADLIRDRIHEAVGTHLEELQLGFVLGDPLSVLETQMNVTIPLTFEPATVTLTEP